MKSCPSPTMFTPAQKAPTLPLECVIGYPDATYPPKAPPSPLWRFALPMVGVAMVAAAVIGLAHWIYR